MNGCQDREDRILGEGLNTPQQEQLDCSTKVRDVDVSLRSSLRNTSGCNQGECIEMASDAVVEKNGWFYLAQITRYQTGDGIDFTAATINETVNSSMTMTGTGPGTPYGIFFETSENPDPSLGENISYSDYSYLISIASVDDTKEDDNLFFAVVAVNRRSEPQPFFRLYEFNSHTFYRGKLLAHVEDRNVVSITHDNRGNILVISGTLPLMESTDYHIAKYDPTGVQLWEIAMQGNPGYAPAMACDSQNNILIAHDKRSADNSEMELVLGMSFLWLTKLDEAGELLWELEMDGTAEKPGLAIDRNDNVVVASAHYVYDLEDDRRIHAYQPWIGYVSRDGTLQNEYALDESYQGSSQDSPDPKSYLLETLNVQDLVVDRTGRIYIPIIKTETTQADQALIAEWTAGLEFCSVASLPDDAPIRLYVSSDDELFYSSPYSFGKIDR